MQDLRIALVQSKQYWESPKKNLEHFGGHLKKIEANTVDLVLLPEMFNTSFTMNVKDLAETVSGESIQWMIRQAVLLNTQIAATLIIVEDGKYFNRLVVVSENGIEASYNKRHLFRMAGENNYFTTGEEKVVYSFKGWNILLQVCYDLRFPVFSRNRVLQGKKEYDLVLYLANWPVKRSFVWKNLLQARAIENQSFCVGLNRVGEDGKQIHYEGDSMLIDPWGNIQAHLSENKELVKILTLQSQVLRDIEQGFPAFKDAD